MTPPMDTKLPPELSDDGVPGRISAASATELSGLTANSSVPLPAFVPTKYMMAMIKPSRLRGRHHRARCREDTSPDGEVDFEKDSAGDEGLLHRFLGRIDHIPR